MSDSERDPGRERRITYWVLGIIFLVMGGVLVAIHNSNKENEEALAKASQLQAELASAGLRVPSTEQIYRVLGSNGGSVCNAPANALRKSIIYGMLTNGAAGPGQRPVIADNKALQGQLLIVKVYCPEELENFTDLVNDLKTADVAS
jgi:hypothetical protein